MTLHPGHRRTNGSADVESAAAKDDVLDLRLWLRLISCTSMIESTVRQRLRKEFGITLPGFDVLAQLDRTPHGLSMSALSARLMVTNGNVTGLVNRLIARGLVARRADPKDQRVQVVRLTRKGQALFSRIAPVHHVWIGEMMGGLKASELKRLYASLGRLNASTRSALEGETG